MKKAINVGSALLLTMMILMASCCRQNSQDLVSPFDKREGNIAINGAIGERLTRTVGNQWEDNDAIGIYAYTGTSLANDNLITNDGKKGNRKYTTSGNGVFTSMEGVWLEEQTSANLMAYYPYNPSIDNTLYLDYDVTNQANPGAIDVLYSNNVKGLTLASKQATLVFDHVLTMVVFNIKSNVDLTGKTLTIYDANLKGKLNLVTGIATTSDNSRGNVSQSIKKVNGEYKVAFILPHQDLSKATLNIPGVGKEAKAIGLKTEQGYKYELNISFNGITGEIEITGATINDWKDGGKGTDIDLDPVDGTQPNPNPQPNPGTGEKGTAGDIDAPFSTTLDPFTAVNVKGAQEWNINTKFSNASMSGFVSADQRSYENEDWLVSPAMDLTNAQSVKVNFEHTWNKGDIAKMKEEITIHVTTNYTGDPKTTQWTQVTIPNYPVGSTWDYVASGDVVFPAEVLGQSNVRFALKYTCTDASSGNWQIKNLKTTTTNKGGVTPEPQPEPKPTPTPGNPVTIDASFASNLAPFTEYSAEGVAKWSIDTKYACAKMSGYNGQEKVAYSNVDWLVSPEMNLTGLTSGTLEFEHAINFGNAATMSEEFTLHFTTNYTGNPETTSWTKVNITTYPAGKSWDFIGSGVINFPSSVMGQSKVRFAFKYKCGSSDAGTWEIKNVKASAK